MVMNKGESMRVLNFKLFGITYTKQLITTYKWHCKDCGILKDDQVKLFGDIFDNHFCKLCDNKALLIKDSINNHTFQFLTVPQLNRLITFLSW